jgi:pimeloyl-ACP methyl ester carboxylesterase
VDVRISSHAHAIALAKIVPIVNRMMPFQWMLRRTMWHGSSGRDRMMLRSNRAFSSGKTANIVISVAVGLGVVALINKVLTREAERRNPPEGAFLEVDGVRLHYIEKGSGSPVVFLHGNQSMVEDVEISGLFGLLARNHRVIAFDRPGFGHSERPREKVWTASAQAALLRKALSQLGVEKPIIVGHSWGTLVALAHAVDHPADTGALLLLSGYYFPSKRIDAVLASLPAIPIVGDLLSYTISPLLGWLTGPLVLKKVFEPSKVTERVKRKFPFSMALRPSQIRATAGDAANMAPAAASLERHYGQLTMPIAIMAGSGDKIVPVAPQPERLHARISQSTLRIMDTGHMVHHIFPEEVAAAVGKLHVELAQRTGVHA